MSDTPYGQPSYSPPSDAECAVCEKPAGRWHVASLVAAGVHHFNLTRRRTGHDPVCSPECLERLRTQDSPDDRTETT